MSDEIMDTNQGVTDTQATAESQAQAAKTYTQEEFDRHMAGLKSSLQKKYEKTFAELGDINELKQLKADAETKRLEEAKKRGEFEKILQELAAKKDAEISKRDQVIKDYKVNMPLLAAAAKFNAVNAEQVKALLINQVRLSESGEVEVVSSDGSTRYNDQGQSLGVEDLVQEFLLNNPHFKMASPATTNTKTSIKADPVGKIDISKLDMKNPEHRKKFAEARAAGKI